MLDDIICADFKKGHTLKKTVRGRSTWSWKIRCVS